MKTTKNTVVKSFLLGALLATANTWTVIHAQESSAALEEIIVPPKSVKKTYRLLVYLSVRLMETL